jgi:hypothetical protein
MSAARILLLTCLFPLMLLVAAPGCAKKGSTVRGRVTYDGEPVAAGYITFLPEDGTGRTVGAPIRNGQYQAVDVPPGKKRVQVVSGDQGGPSSRDSGEEPGKITAENVSKPREDIIPPDAKGNNAPVEIVGKVETHDFELERPRRDTQPGAGAVPGQGVPGRGMPPQKGGPG